MDELDRDLHPDLLLEILRWFWDVERNPKQAQLIMSCNNPSVLDHLQKEEIHFTSKDSLGRTSVYSLKDIQGVRRDENFYRSYLSGRYGAVPNIG